MTRIEPCLVRSRARSVTADLEYCYGCQFRDRATMSLLLHTRTGNVANFWQPWKTKAATFWQRCQPLATLPLPEAFPLIGLGSDSYPAAPPRSEPTCTSCSTRYRPPAGSTGDVKRRGVAHQGIQLSRERDGEVLGQPGGSRGDPASACGRAQRRPPLGQARRGPAGQRLPPSAEAGDCASCVNSRNHKAGPALA